MLAALAALCLAILGPAWREPAGARPGALAHDLSLLYERVSPAVVRVVSHRIARQSISRGATHAESALFRRLVATGVVMDAHGCVVTSDRAAQPGDSVVVHFPDGSRMNTEFIGQNSDIHVSVLQLKGSRDFAWLAPREMPGELPDWVAAVAYDPWGTERRPGPSLTLAQGSALAHERVRCGDSTATVWRLRAPLFPGNAGGALLSLDGEWLGLITGVVQGEAADEGKAEEGVIVPADIVSRAVAEIEGGRHAVVARGFLGVRTYRRPVTASDSLWRGIGVIVSDVLSGGPAERHGVRPGDVILSFGDTPVADAAQLTELVRSASPGSPMRLEILRAGMPQTLRVFLGDQTNGETAIAQRREIHDERRALERQIRRAEEQLLMLRQRWERLTPPDAGAAPARGPSRSGS